MTTQKIKNLHVSPLVIGNVLINPGVSLAVPNWDRVKTTGSVKAFLAAGVISEDGEAPTLPLPDSDGKTPSAPDAASLAEDAEKDRLIAELRTFNIEKTKRSSLDNLRAELAKAKGEAAPAGLPGAPGLPGA